LCRVYDVTLADDVVAVEDRIRQVAGQRLGDRLRDTRANEVSHGRSPQVVRDAAGTTGQPARFHALPNVVIRFGFNGSK
jgi:hypothetical protein